MVRFDGPCSRFNKDSCCMEWWLETPTGFPIKKGARSLLLLLYLAALKYFYSILLRRKPLLLLLSSTVRILLYFQQPYFQIPSILYLLVLGDL